MVITSKYSPKFNVAAELVFAYLLLVWFGLVGWVYVSICEYRYTWCEYMDGRKAREQPQTGFLIALGLTK